MTKIAEGQSFYHILDIKKNPLIGQPPQYMLVSQAVSLGHAVSEVQRLQLSNYVILVCTALVVREGQIQVNGEEVIDFTANTY